MWCGVVWCGVVWCGVVCGRLGKTERTHTHTHRGIETESDTEKVRETGRAYVCGVLLCHMRDPYTDRRVTSQALYLLRCSAAPRQPPPPSRPPLPSPPALPGRRGSGRPTGALCRPTWSWSWSSVCGASSPWLTPMLMPPPMTLETGDRRPNEPNQIGTACMQSDVTAAPSTHTNAAHDTKSTARRARAGAAAWD